MSVNEFKILRTDMIVMEVSHERNHPGEYPSVRVVLGWPSEGRVGAGAEFSLRMDKAPRVGDSYTVFAIPGQVTLGEFEPESG